MRRHKFENSGTQQTAHVLHFGGMSPSGVGPALPVENKSSSRTTNRPLHMLTGRSECVCSAAMPKTKTPRSGDGSLGRRVNKQRSLTKESMLGVQLSAASNSAELALRRQEDDND